MKPKTHAPSSILWRKLPRHAYYSGFVGIPTNSQGHTEDETRFYCYTVEAGVVVPSTHHLQPKAWAWGDWVESDGNPVATVEEAQAICLKAWRDQLAKHGDPSEVMTLEEFEASLSR